MLVLCFCLTMSVIRKETRFAMTHIADLHRTQVTDQLYERAHEVLRYEPDTGFLFWKVPKAPYMKPGDRAGHRHHSGYNTVMLDGVIYRTRHLIWLMAYGTKPRRVGSLNKIRDDDRLVNLWT